MYTYDIKTLKKNKLKLVFYWDHTVKLDGKMTGHKNTFKYLKHYLIKIINIGNMF